LVLAIVFQCLTRRLDPARHGGVGDEPTSPDRFDQLVPRHQPVPVFDQARNDIEHLRLHRQRHAQPAQFLLRSVEFEMPERVNHYGDAPTTRVPSAFI